MLLRSSSILAGLVLATSFARAQGCVLDVDHPALLYGAKITLGKLADESETAKVSEKPKHFMRALNILYEETGRIDNQIARYYLLGKTYSLWLKLNLKGTTSVVVREKIGLIGNPKGMQDMYMAIDTAFSKVEALNPACADSTSNYRKGVSAMAYNEAHDALEAKKYDSAVVHARRALVVNPKGAAPWNILAEANQLRGDTAGYKEALRQVSQSTDSDPAMQRIRAQAFYNLAYMELAEAAKKDGDERKALAGAAEKDLTEYLKLKAGDPLGQAAMSRALQMMGDTTRAREMMDTMMKNPAQFSAATLFEAAGGQYAAGAYDNAIKLYQLGLEKNPSFRDGLFSLASTMVVAKRYDEAVPVIARLLAVDPVNSFTQTQALNVWKGINQTSKNDALKAMATDSAIHYGQLRTNGPTSVEVSTFNPEKDGATLEGAVKNRTTEQKSYQVTFEFLNATGGVVASVPVVVSNVPASTGKMFSVKATGAGIAAWRYKPLQ
jgi:tetratricopeptide (TPR) repeat protein